MSNRGEGAIQSSEQAVPSIAQEGVCPDPSTLKASAPPPIPPLPESDSSIPVPRIAGEKSQMTEKLDRAVDVRQLSAHDVVHKLRLQLEQIFEPPSMDQVDLSQTVNSRVIIIHGPTGTGKSTVIPWEA